jgi:hypothetical protein
MSPTDCRHLAISKDHILNMTVGLLIASLGKITPYYNYR